LAGHEKTLPFLSGEEGKGFFQQCLQLLQEWIARVEAVETGAAGEAADQDAALLQGVELALEGRQTGGEKAGHVPGIPFALGQDEEENPFLVDGPQQGFKHEDLSMGSIDINIMSYDIFMMSFQVHRFILQRKKGRAAGAKYCLCHFSRNDPPSSRDATPARPAAAAKAAMAEEA
jgi:hypothetical protein